MDMQPDINDPFPEEKTKTSNVTPFDYEGFTVQIIDINGVPWCVLAEVCRVLGLETGNVSRWLDDDEKGRYIVQTPGGPQEMVIINESGLFSTIMTSRVPEAKRFKKWVTADLLPTLRKTGTYSLPSAKQYPSLTPDDRNVIGGIMKRVAANQIKPMAQMLEMLKRDVAAIKAAPICPPSPFERR